MLSHIILAALAFLYGVNIPFTVAQVGKPRKPLTSGVASVSVIVSVAVLAAFAYLSTQI
jgi:hypothetical protein